MNSLIVSHKMETEIGKNLYEGQNKDGEIHKESHLPFKIAKTCYELLPSVDDEFEVSSLE